MNLKSKIISLVVVIILLIVSGSAYSQGIFKNGTKTTESTTINRGDLLRDPPPENPDQPPGNEDTPVGEGLAILSLLSVGYFMLLKRKDSKG